MGAKLDVGNEAMQYNPYTQEREMTELTSRGKNNMKNFQELSFITNNNVSVTQKGKYGSIRTSLTHVYNKGQWPNEKLNKITYTVSGDMKYKKFSSEAGITYNKRFYPNMADRPITVQAIFTIFWYGRAVNTIYGIIRITGE